MVDARWTRRMSDTIPHGRRRHPTSLEHLPNRSAPLHAAPSVSPPDEASLYSEASRLKM